MMSVPEAAKSLGVRPTNDKREYAAAREENRQ